MFKSNFTTGVINRRPLPSRPGNGSMMGRTLALAIACGVIVCGARLSAAEPFHIEEATISDIQKAILAKRVTATQIVKMYLERIKAYNGPAVNEPYGILGPIT